MGGSRENPEIIAVFNFGGIVHGIELFENAEVAVNNINTRVKDGQYDMEDDDIKLFNRKGDAIFRWPCGCLENKKSHKSTCRACSQEAIKACQ